MQKSLERNVARLLEELAMLAFRQEQEVWEPIVARFLNRVGIDESAVDFAREARLLAEYKGIGLGQALLETAEQEGG